MKKVLPVIILIALLAGGYWFYTVKSQVAKNPALMLMEKSKNEGGLFGSIEEALKKSMSLKCEFTDDQGRKTTSYIKNGAIRSTTNDSVDKEQPNNFLIKDQKIYMWNEASKKGFIYAIMSGNKQDDGPGKINKMVQDSSGTEQKNQIIAEMEKYKNACKAENISDSYFEIPANISFQDINEMMRGMPKSPPQEAPPAGGTTQDNYQDYINQMIQQQSAGQ